jgi:hypothetical protein
VLFEPLAHDGWELGKLTGDLRGPVDPCPVGREVAGRADEPTGGPLIDRVVTEGVGGYGGHHDDPHPAYPSETDHDREGRLFR